MTRSFDPFDQAFDVVEIEARLQTEIPGLQLEGRRAGLRSAIQTPPKGLVDYRLYGLAGSTHLGL